MEKTDPAIRDLFSKNVSRAIEEVIKVDQIDDEILRDEIAEYVATGSIQANFRNFFEAYRDTLGHPHEGIGVWISGFFGSGKSSFAKMLGLAISNRRVAGEPAAKRFAERVGDKKIEALLAIINESIPTHTVIFDVSTERGIRSGNQMLTEIMYGLFLQSLGYAKDLDLSELEITLEAEGRLDEFAAEYQRQFPGKAWDIEKGKVAFALNEASRVLHNLDPVTYTQPDSWVRAIKGRVDINAGKLAERCAELMRRRKPGHNLLFVVDEVGQFVARDVQKMLDLMGVVQSLGRVGRGRHWLVVTSQEKLTDLVGGLDDRRIELARLMDRFQGQVHLESSDISEVTSRRVLDKNAEAQAILGKLYDDHRGRLADNTRLTADIRLPELTRQGFIDLYPLLPYQIDLVIQIVSGLRTQSGASRHVGGANRTIIKLAQQLLVNPAVRLADQPVGTLARIDQVYDLVETNIGSEVRAKIAEIPRRVVHEKAQQVAKAVCLLQYVQSVHRTPENIAAALLPAVNADSQLATVKEALQALVAAHQVRIGEGGYRIPTPAEDDWERHRLSLTSRPGDAHRLQAEVIASFWQPVPSFLFLDTKTFKAGLALQGRELVEGDIQFQMYLAEAGRDFDALAAELRARSQQERKSVFWAVALNEAIARETDELFRSKEMVARKEREAKTADESRLISEEKVRQRRHQDELKRLLRASSLSGLAYFRGNDRSPGDQAAEVNRVAAEILSQVLPAVFERFEEAAARVQKKDLDALLTSESLYGLTPVFTSLRLLRDEKGKPVFQSESGPLAEVMRRIRERAEYGETPSGRYLADELAKEPFGWDFDVVRLLVLCLLRAGKIEATSRGQTLDSATSLEAREAFGNNNLFRQASFRPKQDVEFEELIRAAEAFRDTFGREVKELSTGSIAAEIRREVDRHEDPVASALSILLGERLPGAPSLELAHGQMKAILRGTDESAITGFNSAHRSIKEAVRRATELEQALSEPRLRDLARAREALSVAWPVLSLESDFPEGLRTNAETLADLLARETFFRELPAIDQMASMIASEYDRRHKQALAERIDAYSKALAALEKTLEWAEISREKQELIAAPLVRGTLLEEPRSPIPQLRSERDACGSRLRAALAEVHKILAGERYQPVDLSKYFEGGIETEEQLDNALKGIREECARLIGAGKKVVVL
jgi:uncharacterized protein DUF6079